MKAKIGKIANQVLIVLGVIFLLIAGMKSVFGWDWMPYFAPLVTTIIGLVIIVQGSISLKGIIKKTDKLVHVISTAVGGALIVLGIATMPFLNITVPVLSTYAGIVALLGALWYIVEIFVD